MHSETLLTLVASAIALAVLLASSLIKKEKTDGERFFAFWAIALVSIFGTGVLVINTIYGNLNSVTKGPVHWHADFHIYNCGERIDLKDPSGLANRIGTPLLHEHGDDRMHIEGTVSELETINLASFFEVIGGHLSKDELLVPTTEGLVDLKTGNLCPSGEPGVLQTFLYKTEGTTVTQTKFEDYQNYVPSPHTTIPPGDCVIIEFGQEKNKTDNICDFYEIAIEKGELQYEY